MAKLFASEIAMQVALDALRVHGGSAHPPEGPPPAPRLWLVTAFLPAPPRGYVASTSPRLASAAIRRRAKPGANPVPGGGRSAGGGGPVGGDPLLRLGQRHRRGADPPVQLVLDLVLRVRRRARLRPEVPLVAGSAAELQRDQMVFLVTPWAGVGVAVGGDLLALQRIGVGRGRPDGGRVARPADRRADGRLGDRRVSRTGGAGSVGQHATGDGPGVTQRAVAQHGRHRSGGGGWRWHHRGSGRSERRRGGGRVRGGGWGRRRGG